MKSDNFNRRNEPMIGRKVTESYRKLQKVTDSYRNGRKTRKRLNLPQKGVPEITIRCKDIFRIDGIFMLCKYGYRQLKILSKHNYDIRDIRDILNRGMGAFFKASEN